MKARALLRYGGCVAAAVLAACTTSGSPQPLGPSGAPTLLQRRAVGSGRETRIQVGRSWMSPAAKRARYLLYESDAANNVVNVYDYRSAQGALVGQVAVANPAGLCVDRSGNVYVTATNLSPPEGLIYEYAHGSSQPLHVASLPGGPNSCAIDPRTGAIAITLYATLPSGPGGLDIYTGGLKHGHQTILTDPNLIGSLIFDAYDPSGNLFSTGFTPGSNFSIALYELPARSGQFVELSGLTINNSSPGVQWDGKYIAVGDLVGLNVLTVSEITVQGSGVKVVATRQYTDPACNDGAPVSQMIVGGTTKSPHTLIGPNFVCLNLIDFWSYFKAGNPKRQWTLGAPLSDPFGQALSAKGSR
jgi:hypothetical protein